MVKATDPSGSTTVEEAYISAAEPCLITNTKNTYVNNKLFIEQDSIIREEGWGTLYAMLKPM